MEDMYKKLRNNTADNPDGENIISNKVGIKSMDWIYSNESKDGYVYLLHWTSDDGKKIQAELYKNNKLRLHQLNNLNYYNFILQSFLHMPIPLFCYIITYIYKISNNPTIFSQLLHKKNHSYKEWS